LCYIDYNNLLIKLNDDEINLMLLLLLVLLLVLLLLVLLDLVLKIKAYGLEANLKGKTHNDNNSYNNNIIAITA